MIIVFVIILFYFYYSFYNIIQYNSHANNLIKQYDNCYKITKKLSCGRKYEKYKKRKREKLKNLFITNPTKYLNKISDKKLNKCKRNEIILAIHSRSNEYLVRMTYRKIYSRISKRICIIYFTSKSIDDKINDNNIKEERQYKDLIIFDFIGNYFTGSLQLSLSFYWINLNCKNYKYILYHQSDVYINYKKVLEYIDMNKPNLTGDILFNHYVIRNKRDIYYIPSSYYNKSILPPYPRGPFFIINRNVTITIIKYFLSQDKILWVDDIFTGLAINNSYNMNSIRKYCHYYNSNKRFIYNKIMKNKIFIHGLTYGELLYIDSQKNKKLI